MKEYLVKEYLHGHTTDNPNVRVSILNEIETFAFIQNMSECESSVDGKFVIYKIGICLLDMS